MEEVRLKPWAKVNLYLEVLRKQEDGYHRINTLIQPVALFDELTIRRIPRGLKVICRAEDDLPGKDILPDYSDNLITKASKLFFLKIGELPCVQIELIKHIPIAGGMGGGSSDAAAVLRGLNQMFGKRLENNSLSELAVQLGMDMPFFLFSRGLALCAGKGERVEQIYKTGLNCFYILVNPGRPLSTKAVYKNYNLLLTSVKSEANILSHLGLRIIDRLDYSNIDKIIRNDLEVSAVRLYPEIGEIKSIFNNAGVDKNLVCGSGSTVCGLAPNKAKAEKAVDKIKKESVSKNWWIRIVPALSIMAKNGGDYY